MSDETNTASAVNNPAFDYRVKVAANFISSGHKTTRHFDNCFENFDGDAVALALHLRALKRPDTKLAKNISRYIGGQYLVEEKGHLTRDQLRQFSLDLIKGKTT